MSLLTDSQITSAEQDLKGYSTKEVIKIPREHSAFCILCSVFNIPLTPLLQVRCCGAYNSIALASSDFLSYLSAQLKPHGQWPQSLRIYSLGQCLQQYLQQGLC